MSRLIKKSSKKKKGLPAGSLVYIGDENREDVDISLIQYSDDNFKECFLDFDTMDSSVLKPQADRVNWLNVGGIHQIRLIEKIGEAYGLHSLTLEDILNTDHRPKFEEFDHYFFLVLKLITLDQKSKRINSEQISLVGGKNFLISFSEKKDNIFESVKDRIKKGKGRIRKFGADYLAYVLVDHVVDHFFPVLETLGEEIELLEDVVMSKRESGALEKVNRLKKEMIVLRKAVWPLREAIISFQRNCCEIDFIENRTSVYLQDVYDHTLYVVDTIDNYREMLDGLLEIYLSNLNLKMNEVMKVLTVFASVFIPMTFLASIYGMNFKYMPELEWKWSYFVFWGVIIALGGLVVFFFKKRKWF